MAKKRKSSEMVPRPVTSPTAQQQTAQLSDDFDRFCRDAKVTLSLLSPSKDDNGIRSRIVKSYRLLWWRNKPALQRAVKEISDDLLSAPNSTSESVKLDLILEKLKAPTEVTKIMCTTPRSARIIDNVLEPTQSDDPPSPSPTPAKAKGRSIKSHFTTSKMSTKPQKDDIAAHYPAKTTMPPPPPDTSFTTTATKSFNRSFQSSFSAATQDTAATSFSSDCPPTRRESDYLSSLTTTECGELMRKLDEVETFQETTKDGMARPKLPPLVPSNHSQSQSLRDTDTTWGSSIDTSAYNEGQRDVDDFIANDYHWVKRDSESVSEDDFHTVDERLESPKRQRLGPPEPQANARFEPAGSFAQFQLPAEFSTLPFHVQWEAQRLLQAEIFTPQKLLEHWRSRSLEELYELASQQEKPYQQSFGTRQQPEFQGTTLTGRLDFSVSGNGVLFDMKLHTPTKGDTSDLQRRFGSDRVLYVDMPGLNKPVDFLKGKNLIRRFGEMAQTPQRFLGRRWYVQLTQAHKKRKKFELAVTKPGATRLVFVAIDDKVTLYDVVSYAVPYYENADQPARKLYSRFELFVSTSKPAITFEPEDIDYGVEDQRATSHPADNRFLDPALATLFSEPDSSDKEMSDGCCEMSLYTARQVALALGRTDIPSAVQCRIAGSKGIWYRAPDQIDIDPSMKPPGHHIKIARTQIKVKRRSLSNCDPGSLTLNVLKPNSPARASLLHIGFLPILVDRGVPRGDIIQLIQENIKRNFDELDAALKSTSPTPLRRWMHAQNELWEERSRSGGIRTLAGFPQAREEKIVQMLEAGFVPSQDAFLAGEVQEMIKHWLDITRKNFKIPLARSTTLLGMADPTGTLEPGEVHVHFSAPFRDHAAGMTWPMLSREGLVARNPAMAPWDIQKVRFVFREELQHLSDMVIFSAKGKRPLAELLQGGDYDGDTFWICWDQRLVTPFKNAPAPWKPPRIKYFGIEKDTKTLREFVSNPRSESQWCRFFSEMAVTRIRFNLLGMVTRLHERLVYLEGGINSKMALDLVHLHDYLVDADKQGYDFDEAALRRFKEKIGLPKNLPVPLHWDFTKIDDDDDNDKNPAGSPVVKDNIIDDVFLKIVKPMADETIFRVKQILYPSRQLMDPHLSKFLEETLMSASKGSVIRIELKAVERPLEEIRKLWQTHQKIWRFTELVLRLRTKYDAIRPNDLSHPTVIEWMRKQGNDLTIWEKLKAGVFAKLHHGTNQRGRLVFSVAGRDLCIIKHHEVGPSHALTEEAWCILKISNRPRQIEALAGDDDEPDALDAVNDDDDEGVPVAQTGYY